MPNTRNKKIFLFSLFLGLFFVGLVATAAIAFAQTPPDLGISQVGNTLGLPATDIRLIIARIIRVFLGLLGIIAVVLIIYAGFLWMTAGGNEDKVAQSKKILANAAIGLAIVLSSYAIVSFVMSRLLEATTGYPNHCFNGVLDEDETGRDCGSSCPACSTGGDCTNPPCGFSNVFFVDQLPAAGSVCIRNVKLAIVFSEAIDIATINSDTVSIKKKSDNASVVGSWQIGSDNNVAVFVPSGSCGSDEGDDCLEANTTYILDINNDRAGSIKNASGNRTLNCGLKAKCEPVEFTTGDGVDRNPPTVSLEIPAPWTSGRTIPAVINFTDDNGLQNASFYAGNYFVGSQGLADCQKSGSVVIDWSTSGMLGNILARGRGMDWAGLTAEDTENVLLLPEHCSNEEQDEDETGVDCGGGCGACEGENCNNNSQCASNYCEIPPGKCVDKMQITDVSPLNGAAGTFVSIAGKYFGSTVGKVYFSKVSSPDRTRFVASDWQQAQLASCGKSTWSNSQIVVEVPGINVASGPIMVETVTSTGRDGVQRQFWDTTDDEWGRNIGIFVINDQIRPGLCPIDPNHNSPNAVVSLRGKNFGTANGQVYFGGQQAEKLSWGDTLFDAKVPLLDSGSVGVKVQPNGRLESNSVYFHVDQSVTAADPVILDISPNRGSRGEYVTINGKNFGSSKGSILFVKTGSGTLNGDFNFPSACDANVWTDEKIIVKFPNDLSFGYGDYTVIVRTAENSYSSNSGPKFNLELGVPAPGICRIDPNNGPIPFVDNNTMNIHGEYFEYTVTKSCSNAFYPCSTNEDCMIDTRNGQRFECRNVSPRRITSDIYFWQSGASANSISGRLLATDVTKVNSNLITARPPANTQTGYVAAYRATDRKLGNNVNFTVNDCTRNNNTCSNTNEHCCINGADRGSCVPDGQRCEGETWSTGYVWRFSTRDIPVPLTVVERCDSDAESGRALPSPSPSTLWNREGYPNDDHSNVCRDASVNIEFSRSDVANIPAGSVLVHECLDGTVNLNKNFCNVGSPVSVVDQSGNDTNFVPSVAAQFAASSGRDYLELLPNNYNGGRWKDNTWYRVILKKDITAGVADLAVNLSDTRPCDIDGNADTKDDAAYCFFFKTGFADCRLKNVLITPYKYWTNYLESPLRQHLSGGDIYDLYYSGHGLSEQRCIMMNVNGFNWAWGSSDVEYADIYSGVNNVRNVQVSSLQNTVGVNLTNPNDAVNINVVASNNTRSYSAQSPLTIDLSNPKVVDHWPKCLEACTDAAIGVKFNVPMSTRNLGTAVALNKCTDENCLSVEQVGLYSVSLDDSKYGMELGIIPSSTLEKETIYQVVLSNNYSPAPSRGVGYSDVLWSAATYGVPSSFGKPMNEKFTWRFRTKKDACSVERVDVTPKVFSTTDLHAKTIYSAQPYSSPDSCSAEGQKLNAYKNNWAWSSSDINVAITDEFSSRGSNPYCTANCIRKGSDVPAGKVEGSLRVCGNGIVEAGEDCDGPNATTRCGLNCLLMGNEDSTTTVSIITDHGLCGDGFVSSTKGEECDPNSRDLNIKTNCTDKCLHSGSLAATASTDVNASICGNNYVGAGEDCDLGIETSSTNKFSSLGCSNNCLHQGTRLSTKWCADHSGDFGGFTEASYRFYCTQAYSQCGDGVTNPDEDPGCDNPSTGWNSNVCNEYCLFKQGDYDDDSDSNNDDVLPSNDCSRGDIDGCDSNKQHAGSSLLYSTPSLCGDFVAGLGEDSFCENSDYVVSSKRNFLNPWALATGIGDGATSGEPPVQKAVINASTPITVGGKTINRVGSGDFVIQCGYANDQECADKFGSDYAVASDTCCRLRPNLVGVYPGVTSSLKIGTTPSAAINVCPNSYISASFDQTIDESTLSGNLIIARGTAADSCEIGEQDVTDLIARGVNLHPVRWYAVLWEKVVYFLKNLFGTDVFARATGVDVKTWCAGRDLGTADVVKSTFGSGSKIRVNLKLPLAFDADYAVILNGKIKDIRGVSIGQVDNNNIFWRFSTANTICNINDVVVVPDQYYFSVAGATTTLEAVASNTRGDLLQSIPGSYAWDIVWAPEENNFVTLSDVTSTLNVITAKNQKGEIDVRASVNVVENKYNSDFGLVATGRSHIIVFLCENPWPPKDAVINGVHQIIFPYEDKLGNNDGFSLSANNFDGSSIVRSPVGIGYFNFSTYYCADNGTTGASDDLPYLRSAVQVSSNLVSATSSLKRFIFTSSKNADAIGVQVFPNTEHLSARQWFATIKELGGQGFTGNLQSLKVDGYDAVTDGNNIYVDALDFASPDVSPVAGELYTNIYLFSINADAKAETRNVFEQIIKNLHFNTNLTNYGYCGSSIESPGTTTTCATDFDCPAGEICSVQVDKLKRNFTRLRDLSALEKSLGGYYFKNKTYPDLTEGTYLSGQTLSTWPSWSVLGNALGSSPAVDPVNKLAPAGSCSSSTGKYCVNDVNCPTGETCVLHDATTGWSTADRRFSFACNTTSLAYRYVFSKEDGYNVYSKSESIGLTINNAAPLLESLFNSPERFINMGGICLQNEEVATMQPGYCGDGKLNLNLGEQCDPPGYRDYEAGCTAGGGTLKALRICDIGCGGWTASTTPCDSLSDCGNGKIETGEVCDDGMSLNGSYNHCSADCRLLHNNNGYCGDNILQASNEFCETVNNKCTFASISNLIGNGACQTYNKEKARSCKSDCSGFGGYCGDGKVDSDEGESCESDQTCFVAGASGKRICTSCVKRDGVALSQWTFDNGLANGNVGSKFDDTKQSIYLYCNVSDCPNFETGKFGRALAFNGADHYLYSDQNSSLDSSNFTISVWVKPVGDNPAYARILEKGGTLNYTGYTLEYRPETSWSSGIKTNKVQLTIWNKADILSPVVNVSSSADVLPGQWNHVVATYDGNAAKVYVNGVISGTRDRVRLTTNTDGLVVGRAANGGSGYFSGLIDELTFYNRALNSAEVKDLYNTNWLCVASTTQETEPIDDGVGKCGDGIVDALNNKGIREECDNGSNNGVVCNNGYNKSCTYCSADCSAIITREADGYCGDGVINGSEVCEAVNNFIYSSEKVFGRTADIKDSNYNGYYVYPCNLEKNFKNNLYVMQLTSDWKSLLSQKPLPEDDLEAILNKLYTFKKGSKSCTNNCQTLQDNCVECGLTAEGGGSKIKGALINVLEPTTVNDGTSKYLTPLYFDKWNEHGWNVNDVELYFVDSVINSDNKKNGVVRQETSTAYTLDLATQEQKPTVVFNQFTLSPGIPVNYNFDPSLAYINSNPVCSINDVAHYQLTFNNDKQAAHAVDLNVVSNAAPWQYDQILSPIIRKTAYVANTTDEATENGRKDNTTIQARPQDIRIVVRWSGTRDIFSGFVYHVRPKKIAEGNTIKAKTVGIKYYEQDDEDHKFSGIWYHGFSEVISASKVESFTIDTGKMDKSTGGVGDVGTYAFYVRALDGNNIQSFVNDNLRVEVYIPEDENITAGDDSWRHFSRPAAVYYLKDAIPSDNPSAKYWHVFNIKGSKDEEIAGMANIEDKTTRDVNISRVLTAEQYIFYSY